MRTKLTVLFAVIALILMSLSAFAVDSNKPPSHDMSWLHRHGPVSKANLDECLECHKDQVSCKMCHQEVEPRNHTPFWTKTGHGLEARWDRSTCLACHKEDSCIECHQNTPPSSHRPGWGGSGSAARHCVNCHYPLQDTTCFICHRSAHTSSSFK